MVALRMHVPFLLWTFTSVAATKMLQVFLSNIDLLPIISSNDRRWAYTVTIFCLNSPAHGVYATEVCVCVEITSVFVMGSRD